MKLTEEQRMLRESADRFVKEHYEFTQRRKRAESSSGYDAELWSMMAELGWLMLPFAEADGGIGGGLTDVIGLYEAFGRGLVLEPYWSVVTLAGGFASRIADADRRTAVIGEIVAGQKLASVGLFEPRRRFDMFGGDTKAVAIDSGRYRLDGVKSLALHGGSADHLFVTARTSGAPGDRDGLSMFLVDAKANGVGRQSYRLRDDHAACDIILTGVEVGAESVVGEIDKATDALDAVIDRARVCLAAEAVGAMQAVLEHTQDYVGTRKQFGRPIGSFQVLSHWLTDMFVDLEQTRSLVYRAAVDGDAGRPDFARTSAQTHLKAITSGLNVTKQSIQMHGGMGVTEELAIGHYYRRMMSIAMLLGDAHTLRQQLA